MNYRELGKTGLKISRLGFGGIPIQRTNADEVKKVIAQAKAKGINYIDSARGYTVSEGFIGEAIEGIRDSFVLATKSMAKSYADMKRDVGISLANFKTDYIDLYQIHNPAFSALDEICGENGALKALLEARSEGKIGHIGITAHSLEVFRAALDFDWVETIMYPYNIVETQAEQLIAECAKRNIGFICMKPLAGGAIDDPRVALRYVLSNDAVSVVIPGMAEIGEIDTNVEASEDLSPISEGEKAAFLKIRSVLTGSFCRRCGYCAPCTVGINIPNVFLFAGYLERYGLADWAKDRYSSMKVKASACVKCGVCESRCPYSLPIRSMLEKAASEFGE